MLRFAIRSVRQYSQVLKVNRPEFDTVFPKANLIKKILFELDSKHTYSKLYPIYKSIYETMDEENNEVPISKGISSSDVMTMKKVLEQIRRRMKAVNKHLLVLENTLLDRAADMGNKDSISILSCDVLKNDNENTPEDVEYAKKLIKGLYNESHPLTVKLTADMLLKDSNDIEAEKIYYKFLKLEDDSKLAGEVYGYLGQIQFRKPNLVLAEEYFIKAIKLTTLENSVRSYYYLSQIFMNSQPLMAKSLMESCATQGFKEAFKSLGYLEMNYFDDLHKSYEWFKLGMELNDIECCFGFFDCNVALKNWGAVSNCYKTIIAMKKLDSNNITLIEKFLNLREDILLKINDAPAESTNIENIKIIVKQDPLKSTGRWDF